MGGCVSEEQATKQIVIDMVAEGQFHRPVRIIMLNADEGWSRD